MYMMCFSAVTQHMQQLYWTDWERKSIEVADKKTGQGRTTFQGNMEGLMDIHMVAPERQQGGTNFYAKIVIVNYQVFVPVIRWSHL